MDNTTYVALIESGKILITASITTAFIFFKDYKLDAKARKRTTKILALHLHCVLKKFAIQNAAKLHETDLALQTLYRDQEGHLRSYEGYFYTNPIKLNINIEDMDWKDLDTTIISNINELSFSIFSAKKAIREYGNFYNDDKEYIDYSIVRIKKISMDALTIIYSLEKQYEIPSPKPEYNYELLENIFK